MPRPSATFSSAGCGYPVETQDIAIADNCLGGLYYHWLDSGHYPDSVRYQALRYNRLTSSIFGARRPGRLS